MLAVRQHSRTLKRHRPTPIEVVHLPERENALALLDSVLWRVEPEGSVPLAEHDGRSDLGRANLVQTPLHGQRGCRAGVEAALEKAAVGQEVHREEALRLDHVDDLGRVGDGVVEGCERLGEVERLAVAERRGSREVARPEVDGVHEDRVAALGGREGEGVAEASYVQLKTALMAVWQEHVEADAIGTNCQTRSM